MDNLMEIISRFPSWLIIVIVIGFVVEPLVKLFKRIRSGQEKAKGSSLGRNASMDMSRRTAYDLNPMFPRHNTLRPLNTASLYRDDSYYANHNDQENYGDYDEDEEYTEEYYDEYNRR